MSEPGGEMKDWYQAAEILLLDDCPSSDGIHLTPEQRLPLLEAIWTVFSRCIKLEREKANANPR